MTFVVCFPDDADARRVELFTDVFRSVVDSSFRVFRNHRREASWSRRLAEALD